RAGCMVTIADHAHGIGGRIGNEPNLLGIDFGIHLRPSFSVGITSRRLSRTLTLSSYMTSHPGVFRRKYVNGSEGARKAYSTLYLSRSLSESFKAMISR